MVKATSMTIICMPAVIQANQTTPPLVFMGNTLDNSDINSSGFALVIYAWTVSCITRKHLWGVVYLLHVCKGRPAEGWSEKAGHIKMQEVSMETTNKERFKKVNERRNNSRKGDGNESKSADGCTRPEISLVPSAVFFANASRQTEDRRAKNKAWYTLQG